MQHSENKRKTDTYVLKNEWPFKLMIDKSEEKASPKIPNLRAKGDTLLQNRNNYKVKKNTHNYLEA